MRKLILIMSLVFTVLFSCCLTASAFEVGDTIEGVTITAIPASYTGYNYYIVYDNKFFFFVDPNEVIYDPQYKYLSYGEMYYSCSYSNFLDSGTLNGGTGVGSVALRIVDTSAISSGNLDIYDTAGNKVFPQPPGLTPAPEVAVVTVEIVPQTMTQVLKKMIPLGLVVLAILFVLPFLRRFLGSFLR